MPVPAAQVLAMGLLHTLGGTPVGDLVVADDHGARPLGDLECIADVVAVSVADEDVIRLD